MNYITSFTDKAVAANKKPTTIIVSFERLPANEAEQPVADSLKVGPQESLYKADRLRLADGMPVLFEHRYIVAKLCPGLTEKELEGSLMHLWAHKYGLKLMGSREVLRVGSLNEKEAKLLRVANKTAAAFLLTAVGYLEDDQPLWWERSLYRGDAYEFRTSK